MEEAKAKARLLIVDDEALKRTVLADELTAVGYEVDTASSPLDAAPLLAEKAFDVVLSDIRMPGQDGISFLRELRQTHPDVAVMVMTGYATVETAVEAMKLGAFDYLQRPFSTEELVLKLNRCLDFGRLARENASLQRKLTRTRPEARIVGQSSGMLAMLKLINAVANTDSAVLIEGESGTGKELVARTLHETSHRRNGPFVVVACAALPKDLIESELFGHEAGSFTGAAGRRIGRFEAAHAGTLLLDDVDDIPLPIQVKLLRVLQEQTFERVGGHETLRANVRVISATKTSLSTLVTEGRFRQDLYYRLHVVPIHIPPLRDRLDDIPQLVEFCLERLGIKLNRGVLTMTPAAVTRLQGHSWPGNVRELEHVLERMVALESVSRFDAMHVPELHGAAITGGPVSIDLAHVQRIDLPAMVADIEARLIRWALERAGGNLAQAAELLGVARSTLQYKVGKLGETTDGAD